jgi:hypothetical protein
MKTETRTLLIASCLALVAAAGCGGGSAGPTAPSGSTASAATIAGTVNGGRALSSSATAAPTGLTSAGAPSGMTVTVVGTNLSAAVDTSGQFLIDGVPSGDVQLMFTYANVSAMVRVANVGQEELIQLQVNVTGTTATIVDEVRSVGKVSLCHTTGNGSYHLIEVSVNAEPAHRAHGDGKVGDPVPADTTQVFDSSCKPAGAAVRIKKSTNGQDADRAPGPSIAVGSPVTWQYVVTNPGNVDLTGVVVVDDRNVTVSCGGQTTLAAGQSMTCTGSGVATAGQYKNIGTVTATWSDGTVTASDASHYLGQAPDEDEEDGPKVQICHRTGNGSYRLIEVSVSAEPAHRAHGDAKIGEPVPGSTGKVFGAACAGQ